jgi:16S rRNA G966 N2-methylase RsmD
LLRLLLEAALLKLQAYAPTYKTFIDPPYEFAPKELVSLVLKALQFEHPESLTRTETPLAVVASHILRLLLEAAWL